MSFAPSLSVSRQLLLLVTAFAVAACATQDVDDTTGSRLEQPAPGAPPMPPIEAGDIAIAAQEFSHSIRELPEVADADANHPPLVQFTGVTSILKDKNHQIVPIDTEPYTTLLRDRLLLGDREKLRFVERQLPPLTVHTKSHKHDVSSTGSIGEGDPDYQVLAELRGREDSNDYRVQMEFVNFHNGHVLFNSVYRIRKESSSTHDVTPDEAISAGQDAMPASPSQQDTQGGNPPPGGAQDGEGTQPIPVPQQPVPPAY